MLAVVDQEPIGIDGMYSSMTDGVAYLYRIDQQENDDLDLMVLAQRDYIARGCHLDLEWDPYHLPEDMVVDEEEHERRYEAHRAGNEHKHRQLDRLVMTKRDLKKLEEARSRHIAKLKNRARRSRGEIDQEAVARNRAYWDQENERLERLRRARLLDPTWPRIGSLPLDYGPRSLWELEVYAGDYSRWIQVLAPRVRNRDSVFNAVYRKEGSTATTIAFTELPREHEMLDAILSLDPSYTHVDARFTLRSLAPPHSTYPLHVWRV